MIIETKRLVLRDFKKTDLPDYLKLCADSDFQRFYPQEDATPEKVGQLLEMFIGWANEQPRTMFQLAIEVAATGTLVGSCGVRIASDEQKQATFGCEIARAQWGKGYALEASRAIVDFGFRKLNLHRIYAETISENRAAVALAEKLGMRIEGELRENAWFRDRWWNTVILGVLESEWSEIS